MSSLTCRSRCASGRCPRARRRPPAARRRASEQSPYPYWFYLPALVVFFVFFLLPTFISFYYSLTRWTLFDAEFIGLDNFSSSSRSRR